MTAVSFVRRKEVLVSFELIQHALGEGNEFHARVQAGLPAGARLVRVDSLPHPSAMSEPLAELRLVFEHDSFEPIAPGQRLPVLRLDLERIECTPRVEERTAIRVTPQCSACGEPAYIVSLDFLTWPTRNGLFARLPAGRPRYGCPAHAPRRHVEIMCLSKHEAEELLARPLALQIRIGEAAHLQGGE